jgi:hypothetical protein
MPIQEPVTNYTVAQLKNDIVSYQQVVNLTTESGHKVFIAFPDNPPAQWLTITGTNTTAYLERGEFDRIHRLLQTESPLFFTSLNLFGIRAFDLTSGSELPGEGPADDEALAQLVAQMKEAEDPQDSASPE